MNKQTRDYIVLKPIAERFNEVASQISDDEIKSIIKMAMAEEITKIIDFDGIGEIIESTVEENRDELSEMIMLSIGKRLEL